MKHKHNDRRRSHKAGHRLDGDKGFLHLNSGYGEYLTSEPDRRSPLDFDHVENKKRRQMRRDDEQIYASYLDDDQYDDWADEWADEWIDD